MPSTVNLEKTYNDTKILCDSRKLEAVFTNLLTNALEAIDNEGYIKIRVNENKEYIEIGIEDSGIGIKAGVESKVFEPMFSTKTHGSGLGLSICKMIVEQHGGKIVYNSPPSIFSVILPKMLNEK